MGLRIKKQRGKGDAARASRSAPLAKVVPLFLKSTPEPLVERLRDLALRHGDTPTRELSQAVPEERFMTDDLGVVTARKVRISLDSDDGVRIVTEPLDGLSSYRLRH